MSEACQLSKIRQRRGVILSSITRLEKRLQELEELSEQPTTVEHAREIARKLESLDSDCKAHHFKLTDLIGEDETDVWEREQEILDEHGDLIGNMNIRLKRLHLPEATPSLQDPLKLSARKLNHLKKGLPSMHDTIETLPTPSDDVSLLEQYELQLTEYKVDLSCIHTTLLCIDDESEAEDQLSLCSQVESLLFECLHQTRKLLKASETTETSAGHPISTVGLASGVRLPKLAVPTFDGNILNWRQL